MPTQNRIMMGTQKWLPDGASLVQGPVNLDGGPTGRWARDGAGGVDVAKDTGGGENFRSGKSSGSDHVKILCRLVCCDQDGV